MLGEPYTWKANYLEKKGRERGKKKQPQTFCSHTTYNYISKIRLLTTSLESVMIVAINYSNRSNYLAVAMWFYKTLAYFLVF